MQKDFKNRGHKLRVSWMLHHHQKHLKGQLSCFIWYRVLKILFSKVSNGLQHICTQLIINITCHSLCCCDSLPFHKTDIYNLHWWNAWEWKSSWISSLCLVVYCIVVLHIKIHCIVGAHKDLFQKMFHIFLYIFIMVTSLSYWKSCLITDHGASNVCI